METTLINQKYKELYQYATKLVDDNFKNNSEAVKIARDQFIADNFKGKSYRELTDKQLIRAVMLLRKKNSKISYATKNQHDLLRYYAIGAAIEYAEFKDYTDNNGNPLPESLTRDILRAKFANKFIEAPIMQGLYKNFINPLVNRYLAEGGFKEAAKNPQYFYYQKLTKDEIQYLITRFMKFSETLIERNPVPFNPNYRLN